MLKTILAFRYTLTPKPNNVLIHTPSNEIYCWLARAIFKWPYEVQTPQYHFNFQWQHFTKKTNSKNNVNHQELILDIVSIAKNGSLGIEVLPIYLGKDILKIWPEKKKQN